MHANTRLFLDPVVDLLFGQRFRADDVLERGLERVALLSPPVVQSADL